MDNTNGIIEAFHKVLKKHDFDRRVVSCAPVHTAGTLACTYVCHRYSCVRCNVGHRMRACIEPWVHVCRPYNSARAFLWGAKLHGMLWFWAGPTLRTVGAAASVPT